jgi:murein DD-endopeptidase MepM/ murein hydrolase activator NlpD
LLFELAMQSALVGATLLAPGKLELPDEPPACKLGNERVYSFAVGSGDTLEKIVDQVGGGPWTADQVNRVIKRYYKKYYDYNWLAPDVRIDIGMSKAGVPRWFRYRPNLTAGVCAERVGRESWSVRRLDLPIDRDLDLVSVEAEPSLAVAIEDLGEDPALLALIEEIFPKTKIDSIQLLVEKLSIEGEFLTYTRILAAEAKSKGKSMRAFFYRHPNGLGGYYTDNAVPLQATRLYHPVPNGFKVSSYGMRKHPILRWRRHHKGIDYAAPMDTVVHAAADGVVTEARYYGPLGRVVVVEHGRGLVTRYAHLNRYADGIRPGELVKRGDPIGHIGTSGLSTGAHLHFETLIDDKHVNPNRVNTPPPPHITDDLLPDFEKHVSKLLKQLDLKQVSQSES